MKDNQAKYPQLRFKGFTDPWEQRKLKDVTDYFNGKAHEDNVLDDGLYELITLKSVSSDGVLQSSGKHVNDATDFLQEGTLIMTLSEQNIGAVGMTTIIPTSNYYVLNQRVAELRPNSTVVAGFLTKQINKNQNYFEIRSAGTKVQNISKGNVENFTFEIPNVDEQEKIGAFFKQLDDIITLHQRKLAKLKELKQGYLQKLFPQNGSKFPQLRFSGFADAWEQRKLGGIMDVTSVKRIHQSDWTNKGVRFFRARDIVALSKREKIQDPLFISEQKYNEYSKSSGKVHVDDLLVTGVGSIGIPYLVKSTNPLYFKDGNIIWFKNNGYLDGSFLYYSFIGNSIQNYIKKTSGSGTVGTFTIMSGKKTPILIPKSYKEQQKIGAFFKQLDDTITLHQRKLEKLQELKKGYLQKMFC
ncbi:restriction endonuclease subunit S [Lactiplantibacillus plantarum]|uniref:restriction endonuclease subunit S n=1 Tax=Lactiplantibacillus plantarum TaxID=1590 RepID=UPI00155A5819|nr:restriction endonuclease subunit S [Lactiplantibacillus plantarum]